MIEGYVVRTDKTAGVDGEAEGRVDVEKVDWSG